MDSGDLAHVRELLATLGTIRARRMFGAWGLYCDDLFFALLVDDRLYLKADDDTEPAFVAAGCAPFVYTGQKQPITLRYWSLPDDAFDDAEAMRPWALRALAAARRAAARPKRPRRRPLRPGASDSA